VGVVTAVNAFTKTASRGRKEFDLIVNFCLERFVRTIGWGSCSMNVFKTVC
jgi:hypothetical protein